MHFHDSLLSQFNAPAPCSRQKDTHYEDLWNDLEPAAEEPSAPTECVMIPCIVGDTHTHLPQILRFIFCIPQHLVASDYLPYMGCHLMRSEPSLFVTQCEITQLAPIRDSQLLDITIEKKKAHVADRFCLTGAVPRSYFAGSPQAVVVARRLPAQPIVGRLWTVGGSPGDPRWILPGW